MSLSDSCSCHHQQIEDSRGGELRVAYTDGDKSM